MRWLLLLVVIVSACAEYGRIVDIPEVTLDGSAREWEHCAGDESLCLQVAQSSQGSFVLLATHDPVLIQQIVLYGAEVKIATKHKRKDQMSIRYPVLQGSSMERLRQVLGANHEANYSLEDIAVKGVLGKGWVVTGKSKLPTIDAVMGHTSLGASKRQLLLELKLSEWEIYSITVAVGRQTTAHRQEVGYWEGHIKQYKRIKKRYSL
ncbi:hypothetical protein [Marinoscillum furvescens]|uniref:Uncharacterized protein n=1 Tax=Marinoscillum furvescens DSM 4134 TaxID=1122208 RepID=A0A3D9KW65_MARFU|nr:hypothetical protein [Marinoscillum furvescens]RED92203.1 hypothetical protein C7460_13215 [Marinoscillum furvescens DSM 4134]